jgi:hypothetical protein
MARPTGVSLVRLARSSGSRARALTPSGGRDCLNEPVDSAAAQTRVATHFLSALST